MPTTNTATPPPQHVHRPSLGCLVRPKRIAPSAHIVVECVVNVNAVDVGRFLFTSRARAWRAPRRRWPLSAAAAWWRRCRRARGAGGVVRVVFVVARWCWWRSSSSSHGGGGGEQSQVDRCCCDCDAGRGLSCWCNAGLDPLHAFCCCCCRRRWRRHRHSERHRHYRCCYRLNVRKRPSRASSTNTCSRHYTHSAAPLCRLIHISTSHVAVVIATATATGPLASPAADDPKQPSFVLASTAAAVAAAV